MRRITIADLRVLTPSGQVISTPLFRREVKHLPQWQHLCSPEFGEEGVTGTFQFMFKGALRTGWARGRPFDTRTVNQRAIDQAVWVGLPPATIFGDIIFAMPNRIWPCAYISNDSTHARDVLEQVGMEGVAVLSTRFTGGHTGCLLAAKTAKILAIAKLAAG
jgi:hypothetical protein